MTDKELLEKAAKAAGYKVRWHDVWQTFLHTLPINTDDPPTLAGQRRVWSPLYDDGDSFRLAVSLELFGNPLVDHYLALERLANPKIADGHAYKRAFTRAAAHLADAQDAG